MSQHQCWPRGRICVALITKFANNPSIFLMLTYNFSLLVTQVLTKLHLHLLGKVWVPLGVGQEGHKQQVDWLHFMQAQFL